MPLDPFDLNLRHLRAIAAMVRHGSLRRGADAVSLSQPALTQGLAKLERQLGTLLFDRRRDGVLPTPEGTLLAERMVAALDHLATATRLALRGASTGFSRPDRLMTATQLHAFLSLSDAGSLVEAARRTGITEPALHRAVRDLEQLCGMSLAQRSGRGLVTTPAGRLLARGIRLAANEIAAAIGELAPQAGGAMQITIGAMPLSRAQLLPTAIAGLIAEHPRAAISVREGSWRELAEDLQDGRIDVMVGALRDPPPRRLRQERLLDDGLIVVARADHPLAARARPTLDDYAGHGWIIGAPDSPLRRQWESFFEGRPPPGAPLECGSVMVIRGVLQKSDLLTLLSRDQVAVEIDAGILAEIGPPAPGGRREIGVTFREGWRPTAFQRRFLELLKSAADGASRKIESGADRFSDPESRSGPIRLSCTRR